MKGKLTFLAVSCVGLCASAAQERVKVSDFGWDAADSTRFIQAALDSGAKTVIFDRQASPWISLPLQGRSNLEIIFEEGVELQAKRGAYSGKRDSLLSFIGATNVILRGAGAKGGILRMHKRDYQKPPYEPAEWRYALQLSGVKGVHVENMSFIASGGDGIVLGKNWQKPGGRLWCEDVTIRHCVCDDNHRQGISVCSGRNILIEDTVLSNTSGTPPQSGIDFEPDNSNECIENCVMRNCLSLNNAGCGYELYLGQLNSRSPPVSVKIENCRSVGNTHSVLLSSRRSDGETVKGSLLFSGCTFADDRSSAVHAYSKGRDTYRVTFENCTITNACVTGGAADFTYASDNWREAPPNGFDVSALKVFQTKAHPWFAYQTPCLSSEPTTDFSGDVTVVAPDGTIARQALDEAWRKATFPPRGQTAIPPLLPISTRVGQQAVAHDACPGEMVDLAPVEVFRRANYIFHMAKPGVARFVARQVGKAEKGSFEVTSPGGSRYAAIPFPGENSTAFEVKIPEAGCFRLFTPFHRPRFVLEKSSVPVAIDLSRGPAYLRFVGGRTPSLWGDVPDGRTFAFAAYAASDGRLAWHVVDPVGKAAYHEIFGKKWSAYVGAGKPGLWQIDFAPPPEGRTSSCFRVDAVGAPAVLFLSKEKTWTIPRTEVRVSQWGWNGVDDTCAIQTALDSGAKKVVFDKQKGPWSAQPLVARSNTEIVFEPGVELVAKRGAFTNRNDCLMLVENVSNVTIRGGTGSGFRMWKADYQKSPYVRSEWRHALCLSAAKNILVEGLHFNESGGDGICITWGVKNCAIRNCVCDKNHRQGISACWAENLLIEDTVLSNTSGTPPQSGIDFEPNSDREYLVNCVMRNCIARGNAGRGFEFYLGYLSDRSRPVSIRLENCRSEDDENGVLYSVRHDVAKTGTGVPKGEVVFDRCVFAKSRSSGIRFYSKGTGAVKPVFRDCRIEDACAQRGPSDVFLAYDHRLYVPFDGVDFGNLDIRQATAHAWFGWDREKLPVQGVPVDIVGRITVRMPDGGARTVALDAEGRKSLF